ncbi:hydrolase [Streptomyces albospinus]|uniref:Hydrolase n=1 Tax=Streptomyces albospinus TaxID=285515 RepID=A0ABQ2V5Z0_9ACTN|nr:glycoside hydrolase family 25 protein [Streptomyces albospinus]GGU70666.1 hydrolase [Streptomyces albospinus]
MTIKGIDVSSSQPEGYKTSGSDFVFIKITEGTSHTNPKWAGQRRTARNAGLVTGFYHVARPGQVTAQVDYFLSQIDLADGDIIILDWEDPGVSSAWKDSWLKQVQKSAPGHKTLLYCNQDFWVHRDTTSFAGDGLWIAQYNDKPGHPDIQHPWLFHQYTDTPMDTSIGNFKDKAALRSWSRPLVHLGHSA